MVDCPCARCSCDGACGEGCECGDACECKRPSRSGTTTTTRRAIVVGVDCSPNTAPMVRWMTAEIVRRGDVVQLVHVIPGVYPSDATTYAPMLDDFFPLSMPNAEKEAHWRQEALQWLNQNVAPILNEAKITFQIDIVAYDTNTSSIGEVLCDKADLIDDTVAVIVASSGKSKVKEFFVGSTCNYCLHRCKKPIIVYKPQPKTDEEIKQEEEQAKTSANEGATQAEDKKA